MIVIDPALIDEARRLLDEARMIAEAPAAQASEIGHGHPHSQEPPGAFHYMTSTLAACGDRINRAIATGSDNELRRANKWCQEEMNALKHAAARGPESALEFRERICRQYEGVLAGVVARAEMTSVTTVRKFRVQAGRDARTGRRLGSEGEVAGRGS